MISFLVGIIPILSLILLYMIWQTALIGSVVMFGLMVMQKKQFQIRYLLLCMVFSVCAALPAAYVTQQLVTSKKTDNVILGLAISANFTWR